MSIPVTPENPLALIAGPTASGKSAIALALAHRLAADGRQAVIVNADSAQVYADLKILSARPSEDEMEGIEHRLFGAWDGSEACSAAAWANRAKAEIADLHAAGAVPILVGGTGLYLKVLLEGIAPIPEIDPAVRAQVRAMDEADAWKLLQIEDPERAAMLDPGDSQRIARALEVKRSTGVTLGDWQLAKAGGIAEEVTLHPLIVEPERQWVYDRCDARFEAMLDQGAIAEVETLLARGLDPELPVMRAIGVPEIAAWLAGEIEADEVIASGAQATRNYAKRQFTWFRRQPPADWPRVHPDWESENIDIEAAFASLLRK
ncbi:tRNA (adenosine(37)-N6)-dimethylallyltransferase MiaA [Porphyrobacter sp. CACIAM 03H1]|uniref:tRNA (adenosine(37)-N6)-dimethylallyltransferase MiaA n=1 Tax=Porphyrobacter sp. CACIAM 03H1 TaxID=2003315 RepID=UPI000B5AA3AA|nr:tRNA (adenosine(37)-N6)-dimethylallyltransferase MiaA [Porphyrobacter sp. CACIAM 03H1]ASJ91213.1 tRNA (adenosine(37)-N6)-dimethylallyltransferase MiaA [Porphyrobacter sp. CACIAM 03H1]